MNVLVVWFTNSMVQLSLLVLVDSMVSEKPHEVKASVADMGKIWSCIPFWMHGGAPGPGNGLGGTSIKGPDASTSHSETHPESKWVTTRSRMTPKLVAVTQVVQVRARKVFNVKE